ncbi:MAG: L-aspartate oxidase [Treponema sp.]|nr:L-aspartate oxidase [Treponema sp.]
MTETYDVVIAGSGVGGLYSALNLDPEKKILIITKAKLEECDSFLAQGGICMLKSQDDYDSYFEDTMKAGHYENNKKSVDTMIRNSQKTIKRLISYGVEFEKNEDGSLKFTKEGAHSTPRILFHQDITGKEITSKLLAAVKKLSNVEMREMWEMTDIIEENGGCTGIVAKDLSSGNEENIFAQDVIWATGGIGGCYTHSTNFPHLTGDALRIAKKHNIPVVHEDYVQIHPTTLYVKSEKGKKERSFLISESVRGEGGLLLDKNGNRFVNELLPRDKVTEAINEQMKKDGCDHVWLDMRPIDSQVIKTHFEHIYQRCLEEGIDCTKDMVPVVPAQHYFMGGVGVDENSQTSMAHLYAVGETSCNGVHGKNRLASNSLLESLVFAEIAANKINSERSK